MGFEGGNGPDAQDMPQGLGELFSKLNAETTQPTEEERGIRDRADQLLTSKKYSDALPLLEQVRSKFGGDKWFLLGYGEAIVNVGGTRDELTQGIQVLDRARNIDPEDKALQEWANIRLGDAYARRGAPRQEGEKESDYDRAKRFYEAGRRVNSNNPEVQFLYAAEQDSRAEAERLQAEGAEQHKRGEHAAALLTLGKSLSLEPPRNNPWALFEKSNVLFSLEKRSESIASLKEVLPLLPRATWVYSQLGEVYEEVPRLNFNEHGAFSRACYEEALNLNSENGQARERLRALPENVHPSILAYNRGMLLVDAQRYEEAVPYLQRAEPDCSNSLGFIKTYAKALTEAGENNLLRARRFLDRTEPIKYNDQGINLCFAQLYGRIGGDNYGDSLLYYQRVARAEPQNPEVVFLEKARNTSERETAEQLHADGKRFIDEGDIRTGLRCFEKALVLGRSLVRHEPWVWYSFDKGNALLRLGTVRDALNVLVSTARDLPENTWMHYELGLAYERDGNMRQARREFEQSLKLDGNNQVAREGLARLQQGTEHKR